MQPPTNIETHLVDDVDAESVFVAVNRVCPCSAGLPDTVWTGAKKKRKYKKKKKGIADANTGSRATRNTGPVTRSD